MCVATIIGLSANCIINKVEYPTDDHALLIISLINCCQQTVLFSINATTYCNYAIHRTFVTQSPHWLAYNVPLNSLVLRLSASYFVNLKVKPRFMEPAVVTLSSSPLCSSITLTTYITVLYRHIIMSVIKKIVTYVIVSKCVTLYCNKSDVLYISLYSRPI